jgi:hypothetical protein
MMEPKMYKNEKSANIVVCSKYVLNAGARPGFRCFLYVTIALFGLAACSADNRLEKITGFWAQSPAHCMSRTGFELERNSMSVWVEGQLQRVENPITITEEMKTEEIFAFRVFDEDNAQIGLFNYFQSRPDDLAWVEIDRIFTRCQ